AADVADHFGDGVMHGGGELRICRVERLAHRRGCGLEQLEEMVSRDVAPRSHAERERLVPACPRHQLAEARVGEARAGVLGGRASLARAFASISAASRRMTPSNSAICSSE